MLALLCTEKGCPVLNKLTVPKLKKRYMSRLKYSETEKVLLLRSYLQSGMDAKNFSRSRGVPYTTFRYICKQYGTPDLSTIERLMKETPIRFKKRSFMSLLNCTLILSALI